MTTQTKPHTPKPETEEVQDAEGGCLHQACSRLRELTELIRESRKGKWRLILEYDNYHDGARLLDGDGNLLAECYELPPDEIDDPDDGVAWQFMKALEHAQTVSENI